MEIKNYYKENFNLLKTKLKRCLKFHNLDFLTTNKDIICIGSGASYSAAYLFSKILRNIYNINSTSMTPRELLNENIYHNNFIIIFSYSGTSNDTKYLKEKFPNSIVICGRNIQEFSNKNKIFSYYTNCKYERGIILYENILIPITILLNNSHEFQEIIQYEITNINKKETYLDNNHFNSIAIFTGDYCKTASLDLEEKLLETGLCNFDIYDKKSFSHGQYIYFEKNKYDFIIYLKQKNVSDYETKLIHYLNKKSVKLIIVESEYDKYNAEYDLIFKTCKLFNEMLEIKQIDGFHSEDSANELYTFEGDFS